ncbi:MAG: IPT/TIG domain-containing protein, partial [Candidatus Kapaibacteriota bacterium]
TTMAGTPEIVLPNGALTGQVPGAAKIVTGSGAAEFGGRITVGTGYAITANTAINQPAILNIQTGAQLLVNSGFTLSLNTTNTPATGTGTGTIQGQSNTAIVSLGNGFNGGTVPAALFPTPFNGQLVIPAGGLTQTGNITMGATSILQMNGNFTVNPASTLTLNGGAGSLPNGTGLLNGTNTQSVIALGTGFNGGTIPTNRFATPFNGALTTAGAMTLSGALTFGTPSSLTLGGDLTIPAATTLSLGMTGANTVSGAGRFAAAAASSQVTLGVGFNSGSLPGVSFTNFGGLILLNSPLILSSSMTLGAAGVLDLATGSNSLTLGSNTLSLSTPIRGTSATAFIITNGLGGLSMNNPALTSYFFPVGVAPFAYSPIALANIGTADIFTVRAQPGITNSPSTYPNFVNVEWLVSQGGVGSRTLTLTPQWATSNQQGTAFRADAVGLGLFANSQYVETATSASINLGGGFSAQRGTYTATFSSTPIVVFSRFQPIVAPPVPPFITSTTPTSLPVSNEGFTVSIIGRNLGSIRTVTARNLVSNVTVQGTIVGTTSASFLTVSFPPNATNVPGIVRLSFGNGTTISTIGEITVTPIAAPTLNTITPSTTASGSAFTLNITGTGFLSQAVVTVNGNIARLTRPLTSSSASFEVPATANTTSGTLRIRVTNSDGQFTELPYAIGQATLPTIINISPRAAFVGSTGVTISVQGTGFFAQGFVRAIFNSTPVMVNVLSSTSLTLTIPANLLTQTGFPSILISNSDIQSIGYVFTISERAPQGPTPMITSYSPITTTASNRAFSVIVRGSNFSSRSLVTVRGNVITPSVLDTNNLVVEIPAGLNTAAGIVDVTLQNPDLQFTTATLAVGAILPAPVLNMLTPLTTQAGVSPGRAFTLTIFGANFTTGASVIFNGQPLQIVSQSSTVIRAIVPSNNISPTSLLQVLNSCIVLNGDGQPTASATFFVSIPSAVLDATLSDVMIYPNPMRDVLRVQRVFERPASLTLRVRSILGQCVFTQTEQHLSGTYTKQVDVQSLPPGVYIVELSDGVRHFVQKVVKY